MEKSVISHSTFHIELNFPHRAALALVDQLPDFRRKRRELEQFIYKAGQLVSPVVATDRSGHVDALVFGVAGRKRRRQREIVLDRQDAEQTVRGEHVREDVADHGRSEFVRGGAHLVRMGPVQVLVEVRFLPQATKRRGVVAARRANGKARVFLHVVVRGILHVPVAGPAFDAQGKDVELVQNRRDARRHGTEVFGAHEHVRLVGEHGKELHGILFPEGILRMFVRMDDVVQFVLFVLGQRVEHRLVVPVPIRVEHVFAAGGDKHAVPVDAQHGVLDGLRFLHRQDLLFGRILVAQDKAVGRAGQVLEALRHEAFRVVAQESAKLVDGIVRVAQVFQGLPAEPGTVKQVPGQRHGRLEMAEDSRDFLFRNRPDAEKSEHVVNAVRMVELARLGEALAPPGEIVLLDDIPAVRGETPVLASVAEHVGRRARTISQREILAVGPHVGAILVDKDGNVALDVQAHLGNFAHGRAELHLGDVLHPGVVQAILAELCPELAHLLGIRVAVIAPVLPTGFVVLLLERTVDAVGLGPLVAFDPGRKRLVVADLVVGVIENLAENGALPGGHAIILHAVGLLEGFLRLVDFALEGGRTGNRLDVDERGIQRERAPSAVRARFGTRVVHRQQLDDVEVAEGGPAGQGDEVEEVADADARVAAQTEQRDGYARLEGGNITISHIAKYK